MQVNLDKVLVDFEGDPIKTETGEPWTLKKIVVSALSAPLESDKNLSPDTVIKRWKLAMRLHGGGEQELSPEEATEIRDRMAKLYAIVLSGQACEMLKG